MKDDFDLDLEKELAKSIAHIVDEETNGAEVFVKSSVPTETISMPKAEPVEDDEPSQENVNEAEAEDNISKKKKIKHLIIIIASIVAAIAIIGVAAYFIVRYAYKSSMDNYGYYNNAGYAALEKKDYASAVKFFEKGLTYEEGKSDTDMRMYLYECYIYMDMEEEAIDTLYDVLEFNDRNYYNALYYLVKYYNDNEDYDTIKELYDKNKDSKDSSVIALFAIYQSAAPLASPVGDIYSDDQEITLATKNDSKIYYTTDGTEPDEFSIEYTEKIKLSEGSTTIKFVAINEYGFASDVVTEEYVVNYQAPSAPTIYPEKTSFKQASDVMVTINNIADDAVAYYTIDGTIPNEDSTVYNGAFALPSGSTIVNVLVVDSHGLTCRTSKTYNVTYVSDVTEEDALANIWDKLISEEYVDEEHLDEDGNLCELQYYTKKTIEDITVYMYYYSVDGEISDYWFAADDSKGEVYKVTKDKNDEYVLKKI